MIADWELWFLGWIIFRNVKCYDQKVSVEKFLNPINMLGLGDNPITSLVKVS
jgi:hypothetical protein